MDCSCQIHETAALLILEFAIQYELHRFHREVSLSFCSSQLGTPDLRPFGLLVKVIFGFVSNGVLN